VLLDSLGFLRRTLAVLSSLVDNRGGQQFHGVKIAHRESFEPSLLPAGEALQLRSSHVPQLDVHAVGSTLTEEKHRHRIV
jgi:hypothetical protein